jgi:hypothetical protein
LIVDVVVRVTLRWDVMHRFDRLAYAHGDLRHDSIS